MKVAIETVVKASMGSIWDAWSSREDIKQWNSSQNCYIDLLNRGTTR